MVKFCANSIRVEQMQILLLLSIGIEKNKARAQLIAMSHNLKTGVDIFKAMWRLKGLRSCCVQ
ncbi:hypothetical protein BPUTEOSOX_1228 [thiotrophic endosymbiont of Bathymodiolus puteoserpentis (Logatchev)]|nr:hypothetical protein BPUTEOSOX_1228 [thiotrophic endosymbiont of Bathymodiolus puteoserpentis (Logatchev)]